MSESCYAGYTTQNDAAIIRMEYTEDLSTWTSWDVVVYSQGLGVSGLVLPATIWSGDSSNRTAEARATTGALSDLGDYKAWLRITDASGSFHTTPIKFNVSALGF